jgi:beta-glucuronidase
MKKSFTIILLLAAGFIYGQTATLAPTLSLVDIGGKQVPFQNGMPLPAFEKQERTVIDLAGEWKKQRFSASDYYTLLKRDGANSGLVSEAANRYTKDYNDASWTAKSIPAVENTLNAGIKVPEYYADGVWYRRKFTVPADASGKFVKLMFYAANYVADVWVNGEYVGYHEGGYTPFAFDVSGKLVYGAENVISIRIDNPDWDEHKSIKDIVPYYTVDWFNYTGIIHDVYLEVTDPITITRADVVPQDTDGNLKVKAVLYNKNKQTANAEISFEVYQADVNESNIQNEKASAIIGTQVSLEGTAQSALSFAGDSVQVFETNIKIPNPKLWSPHSPNLYVLKAILKKDGAAIDEFYTQFGVRTVATDSVWIKLNGAPTFFTGVARHEDHSSYGRSVPKSVIFSDLQTIKGLNVNLLRTAHYPNHLYTYLMADRLGLAITEEIPVWWFDDAEGWQIQDNRKIHEQMWREMIFRDFNRPSIIMWSAANECKEETNRKAYITRIKNDLHTNYYDGRLVTQSAAADRPGAADISQEPADVAGWTMYFGIFHGSTYYGGTTNFLLDANDAFPEKPIYDTEFGYWSSEDGSNKQTQVTVFNETMKAFKFFSARNSSGDLKVNGFLSAITWWCAFDWYSHTQPNGYQSMGLISMDRTTEKPVAGTLRSAYKPYYDTSEKVLIGIDDNGNPAEDMNFALEQNYPNPFNSSTVIKFSLNESSMVQLKIFDVLGREIGTLVNEFRNAGTHSVRFNGSVNGKELPSGLYLYQLTTGGSVSVKKMLLLK